MIRARTARRIATAAALGGGGITVLGGFTFGLLFAEAKLARKIIKALPSGEAPATNGLVFGADLPGDPISFAMIGDSTAAGLGAEVPEKTAAARLAAGLSELSGRPVRLTSTAVVGARSLDLDPQVTRALGAHPDIAVIMVGANDVTSRTPAADSVRHLDGAVRRLRAAGCAVVVGTCPDLGSIKPVKQPLRWVAQRASRQLAAAQTVVVVEQGGRSVSLGSLLGGEFAARPQEMFASDRYHPSAQGYAAAAGAMLPSVAAALGLQPDLQDGEGVLPIYLAAAEAAEEPGTEVVGAEVAGHESGPRGRWVTLLRRRGSAAPEVAGDPA